MKSLLVFGTFLLLLVACNSSQSTTKNSKLKMKWLYGAWKVTAFRFNDGRVMPGEYMGHPQYEFSKEGLRTKTLNEEPAPPPEIVEYKIVNDSITYPTKPKYPAMKIARLTQDTLVLTNDKLSWFLHK